MTTPEKRQFRRVPMAARVSAEMDGREFTFEARNISVGGMLIRTTMTLPENKTLHLRFTLPRTQTEISVSGTVLHVSPDAFMGVRFDDLSVAGHDAIEEYVSAAVETAAQEGRSTRRVPFVTKIEAQAGGFPFIALAENISEGGVSIQTTNPMQLGAVVHLKFTLPHGQREIKVKGTVRHVTPNEAMGVRFEDLDSGDRKSIREFVEQS